MHFIFFCCGYFGSSDCPTHVLKKFLRLGLGTTLVYFLSIDYIHSDLM